MSEVTQPSSKNPSIIKSSTSANSPGPSDVKDASKTTDEPSKTLFTSSSARRRSKPSVSQSQSIGSQSMVPKTLKSSKSIKNQFSRMRVRKSSYGFSKITGIKMMSSKSSVGNVEYRRPPLLFLPTYQLEPSLKFYAPHALKATEEVLNEMFLDHKYNVQESPALALIMAQEILRRVKSLGFNRYRIIAVVTIGQKRAQCYNNAISFLWDPERDGYVNAQTQVNTAFVQATVFGVYLD